MKKNDKQFNQDLNSFKGFIRDIHTIGSKPTLSSRDRKEILSEILPSRRIHFKFVPTALSFVVVFAVLGVGFVRSSQPGDTLYEVKRTGEDVRSIVQPAYDIELIKKRDIEIQELETRAAAPEKIEIAKTAKVEIKKRVENRLKSTTPTKKIVTPTTSATPKAPTTTTSTTIKTAEQLKQEQEAAAEECKDALDAQKRIGIRVMSEDYRVCDALKGEDN